MPIVRFSTVFFAPPPHVWEAAANTKGFTSLDPDRSVRVSDGALQSGTRLHWLLHLGFPTIDCVSEVRALTVGRGFLAARVDGSFSRWTHLRVVEARAQGCVLEDRIAYEAPGGALSGWVDRRYVRDGVLDLLRQAHRAAKAYAACQSGNPEGTWESEAAPDGIASRWSGELRGPTRATAAQPVVAPRAH